MELQEVFNTVYKGLAGQNWEKSTAKIQLVPDHFNFVCAYRGDNGCKCAVGHLIPDSIYKSDMEGHGVTNIVLHKGLEAFRGTLMFSALTRMQSLHDTSIDCNDMKERFEVYAVERGLTIPA